jgi:hypothetical protein
MAPSWFILALLLLNLGAAVSFWLQGNLAWALIYCGAMQIQVGCLLASR